VLSMEDELDRKRGRSPEDEGGARKRAPSQPHGHDGKGNCELAGSGSGAGPSKAGASNNQQKKTENNNKQQQQKKKKKKKEKKKTNAPEKGLLYRRVPAGDVVPGQSTEGGGSAEVFFDVCFSISRNEMRETYTRRRGGDGLWRMWPLVEGIEGRVEGSPPWMGEGHKQRYDRAGDRRRPMTVCVRANDERDVPHKQAIVCVMLDVQRVEGGGGAVRMLRSVELDEPAFKRENKESAGGLRGTEVEQAIESIGEEIRDAASLPESLPGFQELITAHKELAEELAKRDKELKKDGRAKGTQYAKAILGDYDRRILVLERSAGRRTRSRMAWTRRTWNALKNSRLRCRLTARIRETGAEG
jgi:hypothetical protein